MRGTEWTNALPACEPAGKTRAEYAQELRERSRMVLEVAVQGHAAFNWCAVIAEGRLSDGKPHKAELLVLGDSMRVGDETDWIRPTCTHPTCQRIADHLGALLPTEKIADLAWQQAALRINPATMTPDTRMASTARMIENSRMVDRALGSHGFLPGGALFGSVSKYWACTNRLTKPEQSANGGLHVDPNDPHMPKTKFRTPGGLHVLQPFGLAHHAEEGHEADHDDYSQKVSYLVDGECLVDGVKMKTEDLYQHPLLSELVSYEGPIRVLRHPAVVRGGAAPDVEPLRLGSRGERVVDLQQWLIARGAKLTPDGDFGPKTEAALKQVQRQNNLAQTGVVDPPTIALMGQKPPELHAPSSAGPFARDMLRCPRVMNLVNGRRLAKFFRDVPGARKIRGACVHSGELLEVHTGAEAMASFFTAPKKPRNLKEKPLVYVDSQVSAHFTVDDDSTVQCVPVACVAFAAPDINNDFVHVELTGFARQSAADWDDAFSATMLQRAAQLFAALAFDLEFDLAFLDVDRLRDRTSRGITTHAVASKAFPGPGRTHTDPGPWFPMERFLTLCSEAYVQL